MAVETDEPATSDPDGGESISEGEVVDDQGRSTLEAAVSEGHAASLNVTGTAPMIAHQVARLRRRSIDSCAHGSCEGAFTSPAEHRRATAERSSDAVRHHHRMNPRS